jgi:glutamate formiminotransferase
VTVRVREAETVAFDAHGSRSPTAGPIVEASVPDEVVEELAAAVESVERVVLLDRTADVDHNRSVLTFAGPAEDVLRAMDAAADVAVARIDLRLHAGQHPRLGAIDVVPFVPLGDTTMEECVSVARAFGAGLGERHGLPVYLYARAATRPERVVLSDIRRPEYEGLGGLIQTPEFAPDFGPARVHPTAGATVVGARPFLIAYNIDLETEDQAVARRIAARVRERGGGLPQVQALGLFLADRGAAQVSMNLLDHTITPMWRVWEEVGRLAAEEGVAVRESELIGLAPLAALLSVADRAGVAPDLPVDDRVTEAAEWLRIRGFRVDRALETRLAVALASRPGGPRERPG